MALIAFEAQDGNYQKFLDDRAVDVGLVKDVEENFPECNRRELVRASAQTIHDYVDNAPRRGHQRAIMTGPNMAEASKQDRIHCDRVIAE